MGQVITFYSYKGGVGRSMALANISVLLAQWGHKVLIVDWDLEAPGIEQYFKDHADIEEIHRHEGLIDLLQDSVSHSATLEQIDWREYVMHINPPNCRVPIDLISAGRRDESYFANVRSLDVTEFYDKNRGGFIVEWLRDEWKREYDFVLIDSRTGITDIGGICTVQLPDMLVLLFTATDQSLRGVIDVERKVQVARQKLPFDRLSLVSLPIPSRFDSAPEFKLSQEWLDRFAKDLSHMYENWLPLSASSREILDNDDLSAKHEMLNSAEFPNRRKFLEITKIPYHSYFSFGEKLPVIEQGTNDPTGLGYAYETLAALIGNDLESVDQLLEWRDGFIKSASLFSETLLANLDISKSRDLDRASEILTALGIELEKVRMKGVPHERLAKFNQLFNDTFDKQIVDLI